MGVKREIRVGVRELRGALTRYLKVAREGTTVLVTSRNVVVAELRAPSPETMQPRQPGGLEGKIWIADDFDTLPDDILDILEEWNH